MIRRVAKAAAVGARVAVLGTATPASAHTVYRWNGRRATRNCCVAWLQLCRSAADHRDNSVQSQRREQNYRGHGEQASR